MKTGQVAQALDIDPKTVLNWVDHPMLNKFFSAGARSRDGQLQREFTQEDLLVLNTIRVTRAAMPANRPDWGKIAARLDNDDLHTALPLSAMTTETGITDMDRFEQAIIAKAQLNSAQEQITFLDRRIQQLERERDKYLDQIIEVREEKARAVARLEMELELRRSGRLRPDAE